MQLSTPHQAKRRCSENCRWEVAVNNSSGDKNKTVQKQEMGLQYHVNHFKGAFFLLYNRMLL